MLLGRFEFYIYIYLISSKLNLQSSYTLFTYLLIYLFYTLCEYVSVNNFNFK